MTRSSSDEHDHEGLPSPGPILVSEPADPRLDPLRDLRALERGGARFFAESELVVSRLLEGGWEVEAVLATPPRAARLARLAPPGCPVYAAPLACLREVVGYDLHRGCAAVAPRPALTALPALAGRARVRVAVAAGLADPSNVGALLRNARAFGVDLVLLDAAGADPLDPRALRAAMGNTFVLPVAVRRDLPAALAELRAALPELAVWAATLGDEARPLPEVSPPPRLALLLGNEGAGLPAPLRAAADLEVTIPVAPGCDSLNVAAASAVLLYALS
ncbi:MAG: TrmH family RNA methyltransferase [Planctomycetota bacterium]